MSNPEHLGRLVDSGKQLPRVIDIACGGIFGKNVFVCIERGKGDFAMGVVVGAYCDGVDVVAFEYIPIGRQVIYTVFIGKRWPGFWVSRSNGNEFKAIGLGKVLGMATRHTA
jgi:hypothetical protein